MICLKPEFGEKLAEYAAGFDGFASADGKVGDLTGYIAKENDDCVGYLLFKISAEPNVTRVSANAEDVADGLLKAAVDFALRIEAKRITCTDLRDVQLLTKVGFAPDGDVRYAMAPENVVHQCHNCPFK